MESKQKEQSIDEFVADVKIWALKQTKTTQNTCISLGVKRDTI